MNLQRLLAALVEEGMISAETVPTILANTQTEKPDATRAWYVRFLMGFSAWLATGLFIAALGLFELFDVPTVTIIIGLILIGLALALRLRSQTQQVFRTQLALAASLTGQLLALAGMADIFDETAGGYVLLLMSGLLFLLYPDRLHRFLSVLMFVGGLFWLCSSYEFVEGYHLSVGLLLGCTIWLWWRADQRWPGVTAAYGQPASFALPLALYYLLVWLQFLPDWMGERDLNWLTAIFGVTAALFASWQILAAYGLLNRSALTIGTFLLIIIFGTMTASQPGLLIAFTLLALAFWRGSLVLQLMSAAFALFFVSNYYYRLDITLLNKSYVLMATGVVLLIAWGVQRALQPPQAGSKEVA